MGLFLPDICVALAAFVATLITTPLVRRLAVRLDAVDYPSKRRINTRPVPRLGGLAVAFGIAVGITVQLIGTWFWGWPPVLVPHPSLDVEYPILAVALAIVTAVGAVDDIWQLKPRT